MQNNKAPGIDLITGYWFKHLKSYKKYIINLYSQTFNGVIQMPSWLTKAKTQLLPKNEETHIAKNYRPIACQNIMFKLYTGCINVFLQDHCEVNNIITTEQAGGKRMVLEQLLINKNILEEVIKNRRNLTTIWLDYQKAFDSVPHAWLLEALKLAKLPDIIIKAIEILTNNWSTNVNIHSEDESFQSKNIKYEKGIFQGDSLSVLLFILSVNPLSFLLNKLKGYTIGKSGNRDTEISHLFFVDDLNLYASNMTLVKLQLDLVTQFSKDIGMRFGGTKCAYQIIEKGKLVHQVEPILMNGLTIEPIKNGEAYKYLGQDENLGYVGPANKERVEKEFLKRVKNIWNSELSAYNKFIAHNAFAVPVITPTFGILNWTIHEIQQIDVKSRKVLTMSGNFHRNSDVDRLYISRKLGGRGLKSIQNAYESRIISVKQHLTLSVKRNKYLHKVIKHEENSIVRVATELMNNASITCDDTITPKQLSLQYRKYVQSERQEKYKQKSMHGYMTRTIDNNTNINHDISKSWTCGKGMTSQFESYAFAIQEQEIYTKDLEYRREKKAGKHSTANNKCRLCKYAVEDITHVISGCGKMSARYYLPLRHDVVGKMVLDSLIKKNNPEIQIKRSYGDEFILCEGDFEYWWNVSIKTSVKTQHNKPDLVLWNKKLNTCDVIEFSCPADVNVANKVGEKENIYGPLLRNLQLLYPEYRYSFVPIIVGALGTIPRCLLDNIDRLGFETSESKKLIRKLQMVSVAGTVKVCKTFLRFTQH